MKRLWIICVPLCLACGDDDDGGGGSGVSGSKQMSDLTVKEAASICKSMVRQSYEIFADEAFCTLDALEQTSDEDECGEYVESCVDEAGDARADDLEDELAECDEFTEDEIPDCDATVADFERCSVDEMKAEAAAQREFTCEDVGEVPQVEYDAPESCDDVPDECFQ
jgi:hypothetical protein